MWCYQEVYIPSIPSRISWIRQRSALPWKHLIMGLGNLLAGNLLIRRESVDTFVSVTVLCWKYLTIGSGTGGIFLMSVFVSFCGVNITTTVRFQDTNTKPLSVKLWRTTHQLLWTGTPRLQHDTALSPPLTERNGSCFISAFQVFYTFLLWSALTQNHSGKEILGILLLA